MGKKADDRTRGKVEIYGFLALVRTLTVAFALPLISCGKSHVYNVEFFGFTESQERDIIAGFNAFFDYDPPRKLIIYHKDLTGNVLGNAQVGANPCTIKLSPRLWLGDKHVPSPFLFPILWHEYGHCAGLSHSALEHDIMHPVVNGVSYYNQSHIRNLLQQVRTLDGLFH